MKFNVYGTVAISVTMEVEAETKEEAVEKAYENYPGLDNYCGNGASHGRLIGHSEEGFYIEVGEGEPKFEDAEPV